MKLEKWYCDVVDSESVQIHYLAALRLGKSSIVYRGGLSSDGIKRSDFQWGSGYLPSCSDGELIWPLENGSLRFAPQGRACQPVELWKTPASALTWHPIVPNGVVSGSGIGRHARGYAEVLTMDFGPWQLGLKTLIWGRFCGPHSSLIWIVWEGKHAKRLALLDGDEVALEWANERQVKAGAVQLDILHPKILIQEHMDQGSLKRIPLPGPLARLAFFRGLEVKWHSPAVLKTGRGEESGYAVFERVTWED
jgi:hypothetical protein